MKFLICFFFGWLGGSWHHLKITKSLVLQGGGVPLHRGEPAAGEPGAAGAQRGSPAPPERAVGVEGAEGLKGLFHQSHVLLSTRVSLCLMYSMLTTEKPQPFKPALSHRVKFSYQTAHPFFRFHSFCAIEPVSFLCVSAGSSLCPALVWEGVKKWQLFSPWETVLWSWTR